jgi:hypothetical protein
MIKILMRPAANPYGSWGEGVVTSGSDWARCGYQSTSRGTVAAGQTCGVDTGSWGSSTLCSACGNMLNKDD